MDWELSDPSLLKYGDENIDPFSFFYFLAYRGSTSSRQKVYPSVAKVFEIQTSIDYDHDAGFYFPVPSLGYNVLFHDKGDGNSRLLWDLFSQALSDSVSDETFEGAQRINLVAVAKLTQTLFLIDPTRFLPFDGVSALSLEIGKYNRPLSKIKWAEYREEMEKIKRAFPGCECYEINMFSYLWKKRRIPVNSGRHYQVSTNVYDDGENHWEDFDKNNCVYTGGPGNGEPWPAQGVPTREYRYPLKDPVRGDIVLVRFGLKQGRGIGIVYKNDYQKELSDDSRLHVLWLNKASAGLAGKTAMLGFSNAGEPTIKAFRDTLDYSPTFKLLKRLHRNAPTLEPVETVKHPLNQILYGPPGTGKTWNTVDYSMAIVDGVDVKQINNEHRARFQKLRFKARAAKERTAIEEWTGQIAMVTFHQSFSYEDFVEGIRPKLGAGDKIGYELRDGIFKQIAKAAQKTPERRYVLIIDEINRGNIPKILGELITLIEDSRRLGKSDETSVTLPYSNEDFGVPKNLYIIGTMNTANRSILLLDTALRRRFHFVEMMPDPEHKLVSVDVKGVHAQKMLKAMNARISLLLDREHQIGHTYLFEVKNLKTLSDKFQNTIFPLLQEYFYDDWSKICEVLGGAGFVVKQKQDYTARLGKSDLVDENRVIYERLSENDPKWLDPDEYRKIYGGDSSSGGLS